MCSWFAIGIVTSPIWVGLLVCVWEYDIRPRLIPADEINALADELVAKHGPDAEEIAYAREERAWYRSDPFERGQWHQVRRELRRRCAMGEWEGLGS